MKKILLILSIAVPFATVSLIAYYMYRLYKSIEVSYLVKGFSIKNIKNKEVELSLSVTIKNSSSSSLHAKNLNVDIYYKKELLANISKGDITINSDGDTEFILPVLIKLNKDSGDLITLYTELKPIPLDIKIKARLYGIPVHMTTQYTYIKK